MKRYLSAFVVISAAVAAVSCGSSKSATQPSSTTSLGTPSAVAPAANAQIKFTDQPITLTVANASVPGNAAVTYTFEVASDAAFTNKVSTKAGIVASTTGQTSTTVSGLSANTDYYWRAHAEAGTAIGASNSAVKFSVGTDITIQAPQPASPLSGATIARRQTFRVTNAVRTGAVGAITYLFEVSRSSDFTTLVASGTVSEGSSATDFTPSSNLPTQTAVFWRVTASDAFHGINSAASTAQQVTTVDASAAEAIADRQGVILWPGQQPTGTFGRSKLSIGWDSGNRVSYDGVAFQNPPIEALRLFDLMDRGMDPDSAITWLATHGYPSTGEWYPSVAVIGIPHVYLALIDGEWELVLRAGG